MTIILENTSELVKLERTQRMIEEGIIEPVDTEVNPEINDIYVSIKEGDSIISKPYEKYIPSLKLGVPETLEFELIKDVEDVVVSMRYEEHEDRRNIHLKKVEPYISVVRAIKYYKIEEGESKRMISVILRNGAVEGASTASEIEAKSGESKDTSSTAGESAPAYVEASIDAVGDSVNDINNIYVSIKDEQNNIIGIPYEIRIPILKYNEEKEYRFELKKDVNSVLISMKYMKKEDSKTIYLEPDTRHISIKSAEVQMLPNASYIEPERRGKKEVTLQLVNRSEAEGAIPAEELEKISAGSAEASREIRNIFVSLKHGGVVVARPYETVIEKLEYNKPKELKFDLQRSDIDEVTIVLSYLGKIQEERVYLEKVSTEDVVTIDSRGFAQEGKLGENIRYDLNLERLAETERIFKLRVINLSEEFTYQFNDPQTSKRVPQIKFTHDQPKRDLELQIFLPEEMDLSLLDEPQEFYAAVLSEEEDGKYEPGRLNLNQDELTNLKAGKVMLVLTPKGVPEFELIAQNLYFEIKTAETVEMELDLKNIGTRNLDNIRITADLPSNKWEADIQPDLVRKLNREEKTKIKIVIHPPEDVGVGDTEVKINAVCEVENVKIEAPEKNVRIHIKSKTNIMGSAILIGALILLVVGIAVLTIRLSRR
jgi:hypothetical protein